MLATCVFTWQATDRAHRIGQTREVRIYRLISEHTIEENIWQRQLQKRELDDVVVDQGRFNVEKLKSLHQGRSSWLGLRLRVWRRPRKGVELGGCALHAGCPP